MIKTVKWIGVAMAAATALSAGAQTTRQEMYANPDLNGGVYYAYPVTESANTPAPKGYQPFYISHYGRHGSRYLISDRDYTSVLAVLDSARRAGKLTPLGLDVAARLDTVWLEAKGRGGELSPLGYRQHRGIAQRMYKAYPQVFDTKPASVKGMEQIYAGAPELSARSTTVMRCAHSMFAFIEALKELNPDLVIPRESGERDMYYMNHHTESSNRLHDTGGVTREANKNFKASKTHPDRLMSALFNDSVYVRDRVVPADLMWGLYWIAIDMQNMESPIRFYDIFTPEELFDLWQVFNFNFYSRNSSYPAAKGAFTDNAKNLVRNIAETADQYVNEGKRGATLRFGHDGNIVPLTALLQLEGCIAYVSDPDSLYKEYTDFRISPMGSNFQMILFRNKEGNILAKFMQNEREVHIPAPTDNFPFYDWSVARQWLQTVIDTPSGEFIK